RVGGSIPPPGTNASKASFLKRGFVVSGPSSNSSIERRSIMKTLLGFHPAGNRRYTPICKIAPGNFVRLRAPTLQKPRFSNGALLFLALARIAPSNVVR
ncbi:MAG: hypothetical protein V7752_13245, partial [Halopseudomonas sp.]